MSPIDALTRSAPSSTPTRSSAGQDSFADTLSAAFAGSEDRGPAPVRERNVSSASESQADHRPEKAAAPSDNRDTGPKPRSDRQDDTGGSTDQGLNAATNGGDVPQETAQPPADARPLPKAENTAIGDDSRPIATAGTRFGPGVATLVQDHGLRPLALETSAPGAVALPKPERAVLPIPHAVGADLAPRQVTAAGGQAVLPSSTLPNAPAQPSVEALMARMPVASQAAFGDGRISPQQASSAAPSGAALASMEKPAGIQTPQAASLLAAVAGGKTLAANPAASPDPQPASNLRPLAATPGQNGSALGGVTVGTDPTRQAAHQTPSPQLTGRPTVGGAGDPGQHAAATPGLSTATPVPEVGNRVPRPSIQNDRANLSPSPLAGTAIKTPSAQAAAADIAAPAAGDMGLPPAGARSGFDGYQTGPIVDGFSAEMGRFEPMSSMTLAKAQLQAAYPSTVASPALQIARSLSKGMNHVSVHLQPAELGSVDVRLAFEASGQVNAMITVERPETLELLQRDSRLLERSLADSGLKLANDGLNFSLRQDQQQGQHTQDGQHHRQASASLSLGPDGVSDREAMPAPTSVDGLRLLDIRT